MGVALSPTAYWNPLLSPAVLVNAGFLDVEQRHLEPD